MGAQKKWFNEIQESAYYWIHKHVNGELSYEEAKMRFLDRCPNQERIYMECIEEYIR